MKSVISDRHAGQDMATLTLPVRGMTCASCVTRVEKALKKVDGVQEASVNLASEKAKVEFDPAKVNVEQLRAAVADEGYSLVLPEGESTEPDHVGTYENETLRQLKIPTSVSPFFEGH